MILITGGLGFIGLHTAKRLVEAGEQCLLTQYRVARAPGFLEGALGTSVFVERLDVTDAAALGRLGEQYAIDGIIHLAVPGLGALEPMEEIRVNLAGLSNVLEAARAWKVRRVCLASSVAVYGGIGAGPFREDMPLRTTGGSSTETFKKVFEAVGAFYGERTGIEVISLRIGGIYGPLYHSMSNLPSRLAHAAVKGEEPLLRNEHQEDASDLCYVRDAAEGIALLQTAPALRHRVYNLGGGRATSNRELADAVAAVVPGPRPALKPGRGPAYRPEAFMDIERIRADVGYSPQWPVERAMDDYVSWLQSGNPE